MAGRARNRVVAALAEAFTARLRYKAAALFFALVLWVAASAGEPAARYVDVHLVPVVDDDVRLVGAVPRVRALVVGPSRELLKLYASPPVLRRGVGDAAEGDSVLVELRPADVDLPSGIGPIAVRDLRPRTIVLRVEALAARRVPVRVAVRAADGVLPPESDFIVEPDTVLVRGPRRVVNGLASLATVSRVVAPGEALGEVPLDTAAAGVRATPSRVRLLVRTRPAATPAPADSPRAPADTTQRPRAATPPDSTPPTAGRR